MATNTENEPEEQMFSGSTHLVQNQSKKNSICDPQGLTVSLMPHQKDALSWMLQQEDREISGGLLFDDMGLGKTLSMISLVVKSQDEFQKTKNENNFLGGTLIVSPLSIVNEWKREIEDRTEKGVLTVEIYHGSKRNKNAEKLLENKVVLTTYDIVCSEINKSPLFTTQWRRIILDEAHKIRNSKTKTAAAVFKLSAKSRWALTGTPVHNTKDDMYSYFKFLRYPPYNDFEEWANLMNKPDKEIRNVFSQVMLRRTKHIIPNLPEKTVKLVKIQLDESERHVYDYVRSNCTKFSKKSETNHIFVFLLLLRQICCHRYLITQKLQRVEEEFLSENCPDSIQKLSLLEAFSDNSDKSKSQSSQSDLNLSDPVFELQHVSSKIIWVINLLKGEILSNNEKAIIVSQWTSILDIIAEHLNHANITFDSLTGKTTNSIRKEIIRNFNDPDTDTQVLLLSLTAGGAGLNLTAANHLFLMDLHWNPQLEKQAEDRIHRIGQDKPVFIYKLIAVDTIEERIKDIQDKKLNTAKDFLGFVESKPSMDELQLLLDQLKVSERV